MRLFFRLCPFTVASIYFTTTLKVNASIFCLCHLTRAVVVLTLQLSPTGGEKDHTFKRTITACFAPIINLVNEK